MEEERFLFDSRTVERNIKEGKIAKEDYRKFLESLPDLSDRVDTIKLEYLAGKGPEARARFKARTGPVLKKEQEFKD